jgi:hypothetical protein
MPCAFFLLLVHTYKDTHTHTHTHIHTQTYTHIHIYAIHRSSSAPPSRPAAVPRSATLSHHDRYTLTPQPLLSNTMNVTLLHHDFHSPTSRPLFSNTMTGSTPASSRDKQTRILPPKRRPFILCSGGGPHHRPHRDTHEGEGTLYTIHYCTITLYTIHYTLYTIHYIQYTIHYTVYTIHCTQYSTHYKLGPQCYAQPIRWI